MLGVIMTAQLSSLKRDVFLKVFFIFDDFLPFKLWLKKKKKTQLSFKIVKHFCTSHVFSESYLMTSESRRVPHPKCVDLGC